MFASRAKELILELKRADGEGAKILETFFFADRLEGRAPIMGCFEADASSRGARLTQESTQAFHPTTMNLSVPHLRKPKIITRKCSTY